MTTHKTTHTPGPWSLETPCGFPYTGLYVVPEDRKPFPSCIAQIRMMREKDESEANARLIAAAPELLEACKVAHINITGLDASEERDYVLSVLQAAIDKAEGKVTP